MDDRYIVRNELGQTVSRPANPADTNVAHRPLVLSRAFTHADDGTQSCTITIRAYGRPIEGFDANAVPSP